MEHPRTIIREAVVGLLISANTAAGARVDNTRVELHKVSRLPAINVLTPRESVDREASEESSPRELVRDATIEIEAWVKDTAAVPVAKAMDRIAKQIEDAMDADPTLGGVASDSILESTEIDPLENDESDVLVGHVTLTYSVTYLSGASVDNGLDDFIRVSQSTKTTNSIPADTVPVSDEYIV